MTNATATETATFQVTYFVTSYYTIAVERPADITQQELIESITRQELENGEDSGGWDGLKQAWRNDDISLISNEEGEEAFVDG